MKPIAPVLKPIVMAITAAAALGGCTVAFAAETQVRAPVAERQGRETGPHTAVFAGGCFWGAEAVFSHVKGVTSVVSGYAGGTRADANYGTVSAGRTGHAEAVRVTYDPKVIRYDQLLRIYASVIADPTSKDRQGPDSGTQYRSALFPQSAEQAAVAKAYLAQAGRSSLWDKPIVTTIETGKDFFVAEDHHQDFAVKNPQHPYIRRWDAPKVAGLKQLYPAVYRADFVRG